MLLKITISNFRSFNEPSSFSMVGLNKLKRFDNHYKEFEKIGLKVLKSAGIYGPNGSGKTNLFKGLYFLKKMITDYNFAGSSEFSELYQGFWLNPKNKTEPATFQIEFIVNEVVYSYRLEMLRRKVHKETLTEVTDIKDSEYVTIFSRSSEGITYNPEYFSEHDLERAELLKPMLEDRHSLFLLLDIYFVDPAIRRIIKWFQDKVHFSFPFYDYDSQNLLELVIQNEEYLQKANEIIASTNLGIVRFQVEEYDIDSFFGATSEFEKQNIEDRLWDSPFGVYSFEYENNICVAKLEEVEGEPDQIFIMKLFTVHQNSQGKDVLFDLNMESRGTIAFIKIIPALINVEKGGATYFLDEIGLSIHPVLIRDVIFKQLDNLHGNSAGQLIFNSHEVYLMNEEHVRQDEVWFCENNDGSELYPLTDFKSNARHDLKLSKNYIEGRFGAIPVLDLGN